MSEPMENRCGWVTRGDALYEIYHDAEWGVPLADPRALFELLMLEGFQAGLSWITILRKRAAFRAAFAGFEPVRIAAFGAADVERLLADPGIVRSRAKIEAVIAGARLYEDMRASGENFAHFIWNVVDGRPVQNEWASFRDAPTSTPASEALSKALKAQGFKFCGPVICYAYMQAAGLVNDHETGCPRYEPVRTMGRAFAL
jgi:DNA-3-methyladenine glycosylase I